MRYALDSTELPTATSTTYYRLLYKKGALTKVQLEQDTLDGTLADPKLPANWRPIALITCDSKLLSAYISSNIKDHIHEVVGINQAAFVPGRSIHDNIMLIQQIIHYHHHQNKTAGLLFIDFAHAYDYISQEFIMAVLEEMEFPHTFINAIKTLMTKQTGRVIVNGDLSPPFPVNNGGKQGDPLFPLIYITANEALAALLTS